MRMWNVNPAKMCDKHILGEHVEMHMFVGTMNKEKSIQGYLDNGLVEVHNIKRRHNELADEMERRGMKHLSPLPVYKKVKIGNVDIKKNELELKKRCNNCLK